ncbi:hypothetical protein Tco_1365067 [Tanacetum coccineum]
MFLNVDQLEKHLDKEEFQEIGSMATFKVLKTQFQMFIKSRMYMDDEYVVMTRNYFLQYTQLESLEFCDTLIQHMEFVKKSIDERELHKRDLVDTESSRTILKEQDTNSRSGNDAHVDDADIRPIYDEELMAKVQTTTEINVFAIGQQHTEQPEFNNEREVDQNVEQCHDTLKSNEAKVKHDIDVIETINIELEHKVAKLVKENETLKRHNKELYDSIKTTRAKNKEHTTSLIANNDKFKAQLQEKGFAIAALKIDVNNDLSKPVTTNYLPKEREFAVAKPHHMIALGSSRNSEPSVMPSARSLSTTNGSKPKPRINNQKSRNWPASNSSCVTTKIVPIAEHSRNSRSFSDSKHFVCSTCQKCVFNANHDSCVTKFLNEVNSRAKVPSNKTTKRYIPIEQISVAKKPERQILKRHRSSIKKTSVMHEKTMTHRSCLRWKPTGKIFKTVGPRWVPTRKIFTSSTTKVDREPQNGSNNDITNQYECKQTLDVSAGTLNIHAGVSLTPTKEGL